MILHVIILRNIALYSIHVYSCQCAYATVRVPVLLQIISSKKKTAGARIRAMSLGMQGIPEETNNEWEGLGGLGRAEEGDGAGGLAGEIGAVVTGLTEFKAELLQLHAVVSPRSIPTWDGTGTWPLRDHDLFSFHPAIAQQRWSL